MFFKTEIATNCSPNQPFVTDVVTVDKATGSTTLTRKGEAINVRYVVPSKDFDQDLILKKSSILNFIQILKSRQDPSMTNTELLTCAGQLVKATSNGFQSGAQREALQFLANQLGLISGTEKEADTLSLKMALLIQKCSNEAHQVLRSLNLLQLGKEPLCYQVDYVQETPVFRHIAEVQNQVPVVLFVSTHVLKPGLSFDTDGCIFGYPMNDPTKVSFANRLVTFTAEFLTPFETKYEVIACHPILNPASIEYQADILTKTIESLQSKGFRVVAVVQKLSVSNRKLCKFLTKKNDDTLLAVQPTFHCGQGDIALLFAMNDIVDALYEDFSSDFDVMYDDSRISFASLDHMNCKSLSATQLFTNNSICDALESDTTNNSKTVKFLRNCRSFVELSSGQDFDVDNLQFLEQYFRTEAHHFGGISSHTMTVICQTLNGLMIMAKFVSPMKVPALDDDTLLTLTVQATHLEVSKPKRGQSSLVPLLSKGSLPPLKQRSEVRSKKPKSSGKKQQLLVEDQEEMFRNLGQDNKVSQLLNDAYQVGQEVQQPTFIMICEDTGAV